MIIKINGQVLAAAESSAVVPVVPMHQDLKNMVEETLKRSNGKLETVVKWLMPAFIGAEALAKYGVHKAAAMAASAKAVTLAKGGAVAVAAFAVAKSPSMWGRMQPLVHLVQDLAMPVGIIVATWGLIELMLGNQSGKQRIKLAVVCYAGMFLIPTLFQEIHHAFRGY